MKKEVGYISIALFFISYLVFFFWGDSSNYFYRLTDIQEDYFYRGLLIANGYEPGSLMHPGVIQYYFSALTVFFFKNPILQAASVFLILYSCTAVLAFTSFIGYCRSVSKSIPTEYALLTLLPILAWPSFWYYITCYGSDSWVIPLSIILISVYWKTISNKHAISVPSLLLIIFLTGLCIGTKLSTITIVLPIYVSLTLNIFLSKEKIIEKLLCILFGVTAVIYLLKISGSFDLVTAVGRNIVSPPDYLRGSLSSIHNFPKIYSFLFLFSLVLSLLGLVIMFRRRKENPHDFIETLSKGVLLLMIFCMSIKPLMLGGGWDPVATRFAAPIIAATPFIFVYLVEVFRINLKNKYSSSVPYFGIAIGIMISINMAIYNDKLNSKVLDRFILMQEEVDKATSANDRVLVTEGYGAPAFHYYGNHSYGDNKFDSLVGRSFQKYGYLRIRQFDISGKIVPVVMLPSLSGRIPLAVVSATRVNCTIDCVLNELLTNNLRVNLVEYIASGDFYLISLRE